MNFNRDIVHAMNDNQNSPASTIPAYQVVQFQELIAKLFQCCQERMQYQSDRFELPDAELRCLQLFAHERYLTPKGIAHKMNVVKSRVTRIIDGMVRRELIQRIKDPEDSRITLLSLTPKGQDKLDEIDGFLESIHKQVLSQMAPEQRKTVLSNLEVLKSSLEAVKELMV
jgi:DNA-binding MarR family transcriptional regulator